MITVCTLHCMRIGYVWMCVYFFFFSESTRIMDIRLKLVKCIMYVCSGVGCEKSIQTYRRTYMTFGTHTRAHTKRHLANSVVFIARITLQHFFGYFSSLFFFFSKKKILAKPRKIPNDIFFGNEFKNENNFYVIRSVFKWQWNLWQNANMPRKMRTMERGGAVDKCVALIECDREASKATAVAAA